MADIRCMLKTMVSQQQEKSSRPSASISGGYFNSLYNAESNQHAQLSNDGLSGMSPSSYDSAHEILHMGPMGDSASDPQLFETAALASQRPSSC